MVIMFLKITNTYKNTHINPKYLYNSHSYSKINYIKKHTDKSLKT